jgi:flagellar basal body-associated protein FliL
MTDTTPPNGQPGPGDFPLEDIDRLLESEDPEFAKSLEEVRAVVNDQNVTIEASAIDESMDGQESGSSATDVERGDKLSTRIKARIRGAIAGLRARSKAAVINGTKNTLVFLKTRPKEYFFFSIATSKVLYKKAMTPVHAFQNASRAQRIATLVLVLFTAGSLWVLLANFHGIWLPQLAEPVLRNFEAVADKVETYDAKDDGESFYSAFPQERHEFLFPKMKVNLRRTSENPNPMGAFEVIVLLDSKDTAIEVRDREVEIFDQLQRVFEEESFTDLESELGKSRLKSRLKRELNQKLTQGWAKDISFKTFILKP